MKHYPCILAYFSCGTFHTNWLRRPREHYSEHFLLSVVSCPLLGINSTLFTCHPSSDTVTEKLPARRDSIVASADGHKLVRPDSHYCQSEPTQGGGSRRETLFDRMLTPHQSKDEIGIACDGPNRFPQGRNLPQISELFPCTWKLGNNVVLSVRVELVRGPAIL